MATVTEYPVKIEAPYPGQQNRLLALTGVLFFLKAILLLPHLIVLWVLTIAVIFTVWIGYVVILFTGKQPEGLFKFALNVLRWQVRMSAWLYGLTDRYPPFRLAP